MRRLSYLLAASLLLLSCDKRSEEPESAGPYIEIAVVSDDSPYVETKSGVYQLEGVEEIYHENLISSVDFFFYPAGKTHEDATYHKRVTTKGSIRSEVVRLSLDSDLINTVIFPSDDDVTTCTVFAVANCPVENSENPELLVPDETDLSGTSLDDLYAKEFTTNFVTPKGGGNSHAQPRFLMSGITEISLRGRNQVLSAVGTINLVRYACKLTVGIKVAPQVVASGDVWEPMLGSMELYLVDAASNVTLGGRATIPSYFNYQNNTMRFSDASGNPLEGVQLTDDGYYIACPFYMYPQKWVYGSTESPTKEPYLKLVLPWRRITGDAVQKPFYYKIVIPDDDREEYTRQFVRNNWYHINANVSIRGAETDDGQVPVSEGSVYIVYWQDKNVVIKNAEIGKARYLSVDREIDTVYNVASTTLPFMSSHPVIMRDIIVTRPYFGTVSAGNKTLGGTVREVKSTDKKPRYEVGRRYLEYTVTYDEATNQATYTYQNEADVREAVWFENTGTGITLRHPINNDYTDPEFDYSPYLITYTLAHSDRPDDSSYYKEQQILQYPGIYLDYTVNPDEINQSAGTAKHWGYVYINGTQYTESMFDADAEGKPPIWKTNNYWRVVTYHGSGTDMYKISATVLPSDSDFIIGDPRSLEVNNLREYEEAKDLEGNTRTLTWYYPTDESDRTVNMIAPSYRISTKLSGSYKGTEITKEQALYRCAAIQENGFPAGRWRLPTQGEISFAAQLSANGVFVKQFDDNYWSANGVINVSGHTITPKPDKHEAFVRCVYDTWYWGDDRVVDEVSGLPTIFVWGDKER
jgi:hypothetical protein